MAKSRADLGLHPLLAAPDAFDSALNISQLSEDDLLKYRLMSAEDIDDPVVNAITSSLGDEYFDESLPHRPKLYVGQYRDAKGTASEAWLCWKVTGGRNVSMENQFSPVIYAGNDTNNKLKQVPLNKDTHKDLTWDPVALDNRQFTECDRRPLLGLTNIPSRERAWKKVLLRVWASAYPDALISVGKLIEGERQGSSIKPKRQSRAVARETRGSSNALVSGLPNALPDQKIAHRTDDIVEDGTYERPFYIDPSDSHATIEEPSDWWAHFNEDPMRFDLSDPEVYAAIVDGQAALMRIFDISPRGYPPLEVLQRAKTIVVGLGGARKIVDTTVYQRWEDSNITRAKTWTSSMCMVM